MGKRNALGKGLAALIPEADTATSLESSSKSNSRNIVFMLELSEVTANPNQPRTDFDIKAEQELTNSIREKGVIQPITVRHFGDGYQIVAGERRYRAAKLAGLTSIPALVIDLGTDEEMMEISLIENIQREDLNSIEEAKAYRALIDRFELTQEEIALRVGKDRSTVANTLRLLNLPSEVCKALLCEEITSGHARALLSINNPELQLKICRQIISKDLSVRKVEDLVKLQKEESFSKKPFSSLSKDAHLIAIEEDLQHRFGTGVRVVSKGKKGSIQIDFYSPSDLERLLELLMSAEL